MNEKMSAWPGQRKYLALAANFAHYSHFACGLNWSQLVSRPHCKFYSRYIWPACKTAVPTRRAQNDSVAVKTTKFCLLHCICPEFELVPTELFSTSSPPVTHYPGGPGVWHFESSSCSRLPLLLVPPDRSGPHPSLPLYVVDAKVPLCVRRWFSDAQCHESR